MPVLPFDLEIKTHYRQIGSSLVDFPGKGCSGGYQVSVSEGREDSEKRLMALLITELESLKV